MAAMYPFYAGRPEGACVIRTWRGGVKCGQDLKLLPVHSYSLAEKTLLHLEIFLTPRQGGHRAVAACPELSPSLTPIFHKRGSNQKK